MGEGPTHHPDVGADRDCVEPEAPEDPLVGLVMLAVAHVQAGLVAVAAVRVLHDELSDSDQAAARPRLVAELRLEVVDEERQLPVALDHVAQEEGDHLLVGHREDHVAIGPVLEPDELGADRVVPSALLPDLGRVHDRHLHLLAADRIELLADHLLDALVDAEPERQEGIDAGPELADIASPDEEAMRRHLGVGRIVAKTREEEMAQAHGAKNTGGGTFAARPNLLPSAVVTDLSRAAAQGLTLDA